MLYKQALYEALAAAPLAIGAAAGAVPGAYLSGVAYDKLTTPQKRALWKKRLAQTAGGAAGGVAGGVALGGAVHGYGGLAESLGMHSTNTDIMSGDPLMNLSTRAGSGLGYLLRGEEANANYAAQNKYWNEKANEAMGKRADEENEGYLDDMGGKHFHFPYLRPLSTIGVRDIPVASSLDLINSPNNSEVMGRDANYLLNQGFHNATDGVGAGLISPIELAQGIVRTGIGAAVGYGLASLAGSLFTLPPSIKTGLKATGAIGGAILNSGIVK